VFGPLSRLRQVRDVVERHPVPADVALTVLVLALTVQPLAVGRPVGPWAYLLVVVECAPLLGRRTWPFATALAVGVLTALHDILAVPEPALPWACLVAMYGVAAHATRRLARLAAGVAAVLVPLVLLGDGERSSVQTFTVNGVIFGTAWLLGDATRHRLERSALLQERATAAERARMAREMHDVVAHHVSLMVVQAEAGPALLDRSPESAVRAFDSIGETGRQALTELRHVLGTLRSPAPAAREPVPGVAALPGLLDGVRRAGLTVEHLVTGRPTPLPPAGDRAAFRVIQESLTNVVKHASGRTVTVTLHYDDRALHIGVRDDGTGSGVGSGAGYGLAGMRERVSSLGGAFTAGLAEGGGWAVTAVIPLQAAAA
jgi:signal transduction histidine kinase